MKTKAKKILSCLLAVIMLLTAAPLNGLPDLFSFKAEAAGVSGYNAIAAVEWAKAHVGETTSVLFGTRYWYDGGDCANFISECIYMGGLDPNSSWNHNGYFAHFSTGSGGSWIRATQLHNYVVSVGGEEIRNPSASQIEPGDLIFFKETSNGRFTHSTIVVEAGNGRVSIAAHSTNLTAYITDNWHLNFSGNNTYLVKMHGATCTTRKIRSFDVYKAGSNSVGYSSATTNTSRKFSFIFGEYAHVYDTKTVNGVLWGYTFRYGVWGWVKLSTMTYKGHYETGPVNHLMGAWTVKVEPTCSTVGVEERVCSRCGYTETRNMSIGGAHKNVVDATCLSPAYCTACGEIISPALGHDWDEWNDETKATCLTDGVEKRECLRCGEKETRSIDALGHDYQAVVSLPGCTISGTTAYKCSRCQDSYIEASEWSGYSVIDTSDSKYAEFLKNTDLCRSRTEYRYRTKSTATRTNTTGTAPALSGYTLENTTWVWNAYGSWSGWIEGSMSGTDYRQVETKSEHTGYNLVANVYRKSGNTQRYYTNFWLGDGSEEGQAARLAHGYTAEYFQWERTRVATISQVNNATKVAPGQKSPTTPLNYNGYNDIDQTGYWMPESDGASVYRVWFIQSNAYTNYYRYRDRTKQYTYKYYKWSDWSDWSTTAQTASSDKEVETRTTYSFKQSVLGHSWDNGTVVKPTCHEGGYTRYTCTRCGITMDTDITEALGDLFGEWYLISEEGVTPREYRRDCIRGCGCNCGCYQTKIENCIYEATKTVEATCLEKGYTVYTCNLHGETYKSDYVGPLDHKEDGQWTTTKAPTCTEKGEEQCHCVRYDGSTCDKVFTREIDAVGHKLTKTVAVESTCEKEGKKEFYTCKNCNAIYLDEKAQTAVTAEDLIIPAGGHNGKNADGEEIWVTEQEAGCGITGREMLYCQNDFCDVSTECANCGTVHHKILDEREIEEIAPDYRIVDHKDSTCAKIGYDTYSCVNCIGTDHEHGWTENLDLKEHTWGEWQTGVEPICIYPGDEERTCSVCGETEFREVPAIYDSHDFETITTDPTCTGMGETYQKCTRCGYEEGKEVLDPSGHDMYLDTENSYAPTCTEPGVNHYVCSRNDFEYDEYIDPIGHDYAETQHIAATCTTPGQKVWTCSHDESHTYTETLADEPMLGHDFCDWYTIREANYAQTRIDERDCIRGDLTEYRELPKLERPVEENEAVETDKTATYDQETGELTITLRTWSEAEKLIKQNIYATPLDIVLVVDQSGSMEGEKLKALRSAAKEFINTVYEDAKTKNVDHRIAIAGFAMGDYTENSNNYPKYMNTVLFTGANGIKKYNEMRAGDRNYSTALVSVNQDGSLNSKLTNAISKFQAKGATAANLGLSMANNIFGSNDISGTERQRIVVFMTDGEPTRWSNYEPDVASSAIQEAKMLKNTYNATVYSIGFMSDTDKTNKFLNYVSSNYPYAVDVKNGGRKTADSYFKKASDIASLSEIFKSIATETTEYYTNFKNLTLIDTISASFTMTTEQEAKLRENAMKTLGVQNEDITVTRHENGTTTVEVTHINPTQITENDKVIYKTELSFTVSANENALKKGDYVTNEDDSGISLDGESFAAKFASPTITIDEDHGVAIFNVDGEPFQIISVAIGDEVEAPVYTIDNNLKWDVPDGYTLSGGSVTFNAESTDTHTHAYEKIVLKEADCGNDGMTEYLCECGAHYNETVPATGEHQWQAVRPTACEDGFATAEFRCVVCGEMYNSQLLYQFISEDLATGRNADTVTSVTEEIRFTGAEADVIQPDGTVTIVAAIGEYFNTETLENVVVYRVEADGSRTKLPSSFENNVVTFTTDHFCEYVFEAVYFCERTGEHKDDNVDGYCDDCGVLVKRWDAFRCKMCPTYEANKDIPVIGIFYTVLHFFVHLAHLIGYMT